LPSSAESWPEERRQAALLHELAHIARNDYLVQLLASFACALYWFHPAAWYALRRLRRESEHASDDRVLARGIVAPEYATHLLDVARGARPLRLTLLALSMACPSHLETRLRALLDNTRARGGVSWRIVTVAAVLVALVIVPLAGARPEIQAAIESIQKAPVKRLPAFDRTVAASPGETLTVDLESTGGDIELHGWDEPRVAIGIQLAGRDAAYQRADVDRSADGVRLHVEFTGSSHSRSTSNAFTIHVPRRFNLRLRSAGGDVSIENVEGTFEGYTGGGEIQLSHVKGSAHLSTGGGEVRVDDSDLDGSVTTGGGEVMMHRVRGGLRGSSGTSGAIRNPDESDREDDDEILLNNSVTTYVNDGPEKHHRRSGPRIDKDGGDVDYGDAPNGVSIRTGGGDVTVGRAEKFVEATTGGGEITLGPVAGSVYASTGAGDVQVTVTDAHGETQTVEVFTGHGDVELYLPANLDARFDLETAYTRETKPAHIDSVFELDHKPITDWDAHQGTPRRYVRATGISGSGRGRVVVRAVNGNVILRRAR
ncbi:MAG TPA: M56 family metallopeptidase, partial [Thermoanaerobaculia bacterium]|nr:M56 family metallopeptidase [Thermoanaerobaculia bacterium]